MRKLLLFMSFFMFSLVSWAQEKTVSGKVTSAEDGSGLPGVNVILKGTSTGTVTDISGNYSVNVPSNTSVLVFSFVGLTTEEVEVGSRTTVDVQMANDVQQLSEVVVTALNIERDERTLTYAAQEVSAEKLNVTQAVDVQNALAGKVSGVQINGQAGSKLGSYGKIRLRGAISLTDDNGPLYIVDGVPVPDANDVDMNNVASMNVLKGPNATALYGQRASAGVIVITTKGGSKNVAVEVFSSTVFDKVAYLPKYQNQYGQGYGQNAFGTFDFSSRDYPAEWEVFDGERYIVGSNNYADESWGPKFDGQTYVPWYAWWPDSPYFGETAKYEAQPDNIKDFYQTGVLAKNTIALSGGGDKFSSRLSYTNVNQKGITPYTQLNKHYITANMNYQASEKLSLKSNIRFTTYETKGNYDDGYGNQTSGSFNSWFNRQVDMTKLEELKDLTTYNGYSASWNWWGPDTYTAGGGYEKAAFWFNPYTFMDQYDQSRVNTNYAGSLAATYDFNDHLALDVTGSRTQTNYRYEYTTCHSSYLIQQLLSYITLGLTHLVITKEQKLKITLVEH
ncbi:carboxypeptidase-like regulatory domain-containing protein [Fulvivirga ligni]|uniref:carboxypeptidase-like regulatory domain-containing protein n=1 Tax=Fulvivirga ligni TaxID=2904246 RepID=UPI001F3680D3|nr:carboxypeptidase-like regulatory domain-containing protein [Fulvivirga ligni]UII22606.1 carboxypeptidase-like regulatory domain-containing protein [Fulvivirga ligni]